jgi:hypothetical protein
MKKVLLILVLSFTTLIFSQPRTNEVKLQFEKVGNSLKEATGWKFDSLKGVWVENKTNNGQNNCDETNFYNLFFTKIKFENKDYYVFNITSLDGAYKYPTIKSGFYSFKVIRSYLLDEIEYNKLKNGESGTSKYYEITTFIDTNNIGEKELNDLRDNVVVKLKGNNPKTTNLIRVKKEEGDLVRFILPLKAEYKILEKYWDFDKKYFEVSKKEYDKMFE